MSIAVNYVAAHRVSGSHCYIVSVPVAVRRHRRCHGTRCRCRHGNWTFHWRSGVAEQRWLLRVAGRRRRRRVIAVVGNKQQFMQVVNCKCAWDFMLPISAEISCWIPITIDPVLFIFVAIINRSSCRCSALIPSINLYVVATASRMVYR